MKQKSNYNFFFNNGVLVLQDLGGNFMSLTNNMENVLEDISEMLSVNLKGRKIIYRDSGGIYDAVKWDGTNVDFLCLNELSLERALKKVQKA